METRDILTPVTIRRNPPRKAKLASSEKTTSKSLRSEGKPEFQGRRALVSSFTAAEQKQPKIEKQDVAIHTSPTLEAASLVPLRDIERLQDDDIFNLDVPVVTENPAASDNLDRDASGKLSKTCLSEKIQIFLRIRPARVARSIRLVNKREQAANDHSKLRKFVASKSSNGKRTHAGRTTESAQASSIASVCLHVQSSNSVTLLAPTQFSEGIRKCKAEEFDGFSQVFNPESSQEDVFRAIAVPRLSDLFEGKSSLIVAMGPTSAGKTYTMLGKPEDPGLLPRSVRYLLGDSLQESSSVLRKINISMFEIYSEHGGRSEKIIDLLQDGIELSLHRSKLKGLHEATASTVQEADAIVLNGLERRTTASTAANDRSSRSHCIINISISQASLNEGEGMPLISKRAYLTIADLAGFERERKTGNQGIRLIESNFINNTSMVFGQCLRALLEHQRNPKKMLQKHFQYSMLTRYLKSYMEAKGNMTMVVNVSPCDEDYHDTAFVLRQAAPYSNIRLNILQSGEATERMRDKRRGSLPKGKEPIAKRRKLEAKKDIDMDKQGTVLKRSNAPVTQRNQIVLLGISAEKNGVQSNSKQQDTCCQNESKGPLSDNHIHHSEEGIMTAFNWQSEDELRIRVLTEVEHVLLQEKVDNCAHVSAAVTERILEIFLQENTVFKNNILDGGVDCFRSQDLLDRDGRLIEEDRELDCMPSHLVADRDEQVKQDDVHNHYLQRPDTSTNSHDLSVKSQVNHEGGIESYIHLERISDKESTHTSNDAQICSEGVQEPLLVIGGQMIVEKSNTIEELNSIDDPPVEDTCEIVSELLTSFKKDKKLQHLANIYSQQEGQLLISSNVENGNVMQPHEPESLSETEELNLNVDLILSEDKLKNLSQQKQGVAVLSPCLSENPCNLSLDEVKQTDPDIETLTMEVVKDRQCLEESKQHISSPAELVGSSAGLVLKNSKVENVQPPDPCSKVSKSSCLHKGRSLALSLTKDIPLQEEEDVLTLSTFDVLGPIGADMEDILGIPIRELENQLWNPETANLKTVAKLLAENDGVIDINTFPKRYSPQRSICIRYCLAVICNKMNVDGQWLSLSEESKSSQRRNFHAVIQARTVAEAARHARTGFQEDDMSKNTMTPAKEQATKPEDCIDLSETESQDNNPIILDRTCLASKGLLDSMQGSSKENIVPFQKKDQMVTEAVKRKKLQPLSSLSLYADTNMISNFDSMDIIQDGCFPTRDPSEAQMNLKRRHDANSLAHLLSGHKN